MNLRGLLHFGWLEHLHHLGHICHFVRVLNLSSSTQLEHERFCR